MKKIVLTIAVVLGLSMTTFAAPNGGGLFHRGAEIEDNKGGYYNRNASPMMPVTHNNIYDANGSNGEQVPVGSGIAVLVGLGAAYLVGKKRK